MNKPEAEKVTRHPQAPPKKVGQSVVDRVLPETVPQRKPGGPVIYRIEKGADVWPGLK